MSSPTKLSLSSKTPKRGVPFDSLADRAWKHHQIPLIVEGDPRGITLVFPTLLEEKLKAGQQLIVITGYAEYSDGFKDSVRVKVFFCDRSATSLVTKQLYMIPCDTASVLPLFERLDQYPKNEEPE